MPTEVPLCGKTGGFNANIELRESDYLKHYHLYCYSRKNANIVRTASDKDKHKTKVFDVRVYAI